MCNGYFDARTVLPAVISAGVQCVLCVLTATVIQQKKKPFSCHIRYIYVLCVVVTLYAIIIMGDKQFKQLLSALRTQATQQSQLLQKLDEITKEPSSHLVAM